MSKIQQEKTIDVKAEAADNIADTVNTLSGIFSQIFVSQEPSKKPDSGAEETQVGNAPLRLENSLSPDSQTYPLNRISPENRILPDNNTHAENGTLPLNNIYTENQLSINSSISTGSSTFTENAISTEISTSENGISTERSIAGEDIYVKSNIPKIALSPQISAPQIDTYTKIRAPEIKTSTENNTHRKYSGSIVQLAKNLNFTALGVLAVLINEFPEGFGIINISQMAKSCGSSRSAFTTQLRILEESGIVRMGATYREGRELIITCIETNLSRDDIKNKFKESSSSSKEITNYYNYKSILSESTNFNISTEDSRYTEIEVHSENKTPTENSISNKFRTSPENAPGLDKIKPGLQASDPFMTQFINSNTNKTFAAGELFFIVKAAKKDISRLSEQCFKRYLEIRHSYSQIYAIALFYQLFKAARDNITAYALKAIDDGATPTIENEKRAQEIQDASEIIFKVVGKEILEHQRDSVYITLLESHRSGRSEPRSR